MSLSFRKWLSENDFLLESANGLAELTTAIKGFFAGSFPDLLMKNYVYDYLIKHVDRADHIRDMLTKNPQQYQQYNMAYKSLLQQITAHLGTKGWVADEDGAWLEWFRGGRQKGVVKTNNMTSKRYISIKPEDTWDVIKSLPVLAHNLSQVKMAPEFDMLGFKVSTNVGGFFGHRDNIVIHFYDANAQPQVEQAVQSFLSQIGKTEMDRSAMGRVNFGKDANGQSDSELVAMQVVRNLRANQKVLQPMMTNAGQFERTVVDMINQISNNASHRKTG